MLRTARLLTLFTSGMVLAACSGSADSNEAVAPLPTATSDAAQSPTTGYGPVGAASELVVGDNRFSLGIIDNASGQPVPDAKVHLRFFTLQGNQGTLKSEADATFIAPARDAGVTGIIEHRHADGAVHPHANVEADVGVHVTHATFDQAGPWGVEAAFVTPGYCSTRFCGPTYELVKKLIPDYGDKAALIHVEIDKDPINKVVADSVREWNLQSEPYIFILDRTGTITDKFEGPVSYGELEQALKKVVS